MSKLSDKFYDHIRDLKENEAIAYLKEISPCEPQIKEVTAEDGTTYNTVENVKEFEGELSGMWGYIYYHGIGTYTEDDDVAFDLFENGASQNDSFSLYALGNMCADGTTPDQMQGGPRQKYDHYDASSFMERCSESNGEFAPAAWFWLGDYYLDSARGGDPELGIEYLHKAYEGGVSLAAPSMAKYYYDKAEAHDFKDIAANQIYLRWQQEAYEVDPHNQAFDYGMALYGMLFGLQPNIRLALKLFEEDYEAGGYDGAMTLALHYEHEAQTDKYDSEMRATFKKQAEHWRVLAMQRMEELGDEDGEEEEDVDDAWV